MAPFDRQVNLLIIPKGFLGDIILTSPTWAALAEGVPGARVSIVVPPSCADFVARDPAVSEVIVFDRRGMHSGWKGLLRFARELRAKHFVRVYAAQRSIRTGILLAMARIPERVAYSDAQGAFLYTKRVVRNDLVHEVLRCGQLAVNDFSGPVRDTWEKALGGGCSSALGIAHGSVSHSEPGRSQDSKAPPEASAESSSTPSGATLRLRAFPPPFNEVSQRVAEVLRDPSPFIVIAPGSVWATKRWSVDGYRGVAQESLREGLRVVVVGASIDEHPCEAVAADLPVVNLCSKTSIPELCRLIAEAQCVVCNDSSTQHVASATGTPCVTVYCATSPRFGFGPWMNIAEVVEVSGLFCKPCRRHGSDRCPTGTLACIRGIDSGAVWSAVRRVRGLKAQSVRHAQNVLEQQGVSDGSR